MDALDVAVQEPREAAHWNGETGEQDPTVDAARLWRELWEGGWCVVRSEVIDGRRHLVVRRAPDGQRPMSPRERQVLAMAIDGRSLKYIAIELGTTIGTVSLHLRRGLDKLGLQHRLELPRIGA